MTRCRWVLRVERAVALALALALAALGLRSLGRYPALLGRCWTFRPVSAPTLPLSIAWLWPKEPIVDEDPCAVVTTVVEDIDPGSDADAAAEGRDSGKMGEAEVP